ncbi:MAG: aminoacyl-tRNA hydrolase [Ignavibacteria bacterium]|nr:aminoacyl-tRNA hydrolase [Ignavibacteria bacterium]
MQIDVVVITRGVNIPLSEISFRTSRSSGSGGQHVNKTETRVELLFDVAASSGLTAAQRHRIREHLSSSLDADGVLHIVNQQSRSQWQNKQNAIEQFRELLRAALQPRKRRIATRPTNTSIERRLRKKKKMSARKRLRASTSRQEDDI